MERRKFTREFKLEAVKLVKDRGVSYARAAEDLGVHPTQLRNWVKALADDPQHSFPGQGQMKPEQSEIARLKRGGHGTFANEFGFCIGTGESLSIIVSGGTRRRTLGGQRRDRWPDRAAPGLEGPDRGGWPADADHAGVRRRG